MSVAKYAFCTRGVDNDERTTFQIDLDSFRWQQTVIDGPLESSAVDNQFNTVVEDMRRGFGQMFAVLQTAPAHHIQEQHAGCPASTMYSRAEAKNEGGAPSWIFGSSMDMLEILCCLNLQLRLAPADRAPLT